MAQTLLFHERNATVGNIGYGYLGGKRTQGRSDASVGVGAATSSTPRTRRRWTPARSARLVADVVHRADGGAAHQRAGHDRPCAGAHQGPWGSLLKLQLGVDSPASVRDRPRGRTAPTA